MKKKEGLFLIVVWYVDDLLITSSSNTGLSSIKCGINKEFSMYDLGLLK